MDLTNEEVSLDDLVSAFYDIPLMNKRNELNLELLKIDNILDALLDQSGVTIEEHIQNYDHIKNQNWNEEQMLVQIYNDIQIINNKFLEYINQQSNKT